MYPTYVCDCVASNSSLYPAYVGGNYNDNANYGFFYFNANNDASNTNDNLGSRTLFKDGIITNCTNGPLALARNIADLGRA